MKTIFFDLETTDLNFVGQILNYAFVCVDEKWNIVDSLHGNIKISNTQLPNMFAILANRVDVVEHQNESSDNELQALGKIRLWLEHIAENSNTKVKLIGYNSIKFDLPYLRTSMIRNGINPYHPNFAYGDLLHSVKKLAVANSSFKSILKEDSFRLENVCRSLNLLSESQKHESLSDVLLTIKLAKHLADFYGIDVRMYAEYEAKKFESGEVITRLMLDKNIPSGKKTSRMICLDRDKNYSLWIDLEEWISGKKKDSIFWFAKGYSPFYVGEEIKDKDSISIAKKALEDLKDVNLKNFFPERNCDIEQFIYMMKFDESDALREAIWSNNTSIIKSSNYKNASRLYLRYLINFDSACPTELVKTYATYRYGGKMKINKMDVESQFQEGLYSESFHPTYKELLDSIMKVLDTSTGENKKLAESLLMFYNNSIITKTCGEELMLIERRKQ